MSWNIDVVLIAKAGRVPPGDLVPDVLTPKEAQIGFEDATSATRWSPPELCVSALGDWGVIIDVPRKLWGIVPYLQEQSTRRELRIVRVSMSPMMLIYRDGAEALGLAGLDACRGELLKQPHKCPDLNDGELVAWALIDQTVDANFIDAMWKAKFTVFAVQ